MQWIKQMIVSLNFCIVCTILEVYSFKYLFIIGKLVKERKSSLFFLLYLVFCRSFVKPMKTFYLT